MVLRHVTDRKIERWLQRSYPGCCEVLRDAISLVENDLKSLGYVEKDTTFDGLGVPLNTLNFEKPVDDGVAFIEIILDKREPLRFQVSFGVRQKEPPNEWIRAGAFAKNAQGTMSSKWWGAMWYSISGERSFRKDWAVLNSNLRNIDTFLVTGKSQGYILSRINTQASH
jgi:hypothetical protein